MTKLETLNHYETQTLHQHFRQDELKPEIWDMLVHPEQIDIDVDFINEGMRFLVEKEGSDIYIEATHKFLSRSNSMDFKGLEEWVFSKCITYQDWAERAENFDPYEANPNHTPSIFGSAYVENLAENLDGINQLGFVYYYTREVLGHPAITVTGSPFIKVNDDGEEIFAIPEEWYV